MNINATLILQSIAMMIFVWFCMKFLWPPLLKAMDERRERIAEGLAASDRAEKELEKPQRDEPVTSRFVKRVTRPVRSWTRPISGIHRSWIRPKTMPSPSVAGR